MKFPRGLLGLTVLMWGWVAELLPVAVMGAVVLEWPRFSRWRWEFSEQDLNRLWDLCGILFIGKAIITYVASDLEAGPGKLLPWLPIIFFPFVAANAFAAQDNVRRSTYLWLLRKPGAYRPSGWFVPYWYFIACFVAMSIANPQDHRFYAAVVGLGGWLMWTHRSRASSAVAWGTALGMVAGIGFLGHVGLTRLQLLTESVLGLFISEFSPLDVDVAQTRTAIGAIGRLKFSNRIILRVETDDTQPPPALLRKASFDSYESSRRPARWTTASAEFSAVPAGSEVGSWPLLPGAETGLVARVAMFLPAGTGILPVPLGTAVVDKLLAAAVETNRYGSVRAREGQPLIRYTVRYGGLVGGDTPPTARDLEIPAAERPAFTEIAAELGLAGLPPGRVLDTVSRFFHEHFTYSRYLRGSVEPLRHFLLTSRAGHCEYFATATTLLLREAGIPARYAIGYSVPEETRGGVQLVRARHAHAWVLAYLDGAWRDVDTTPGIWDEIETATRPPLQWVSDTLVWAKYQFARWRYYSDRGLLAKIVFALAPVVIGWFAWRLFARKRRPPAAVAAESGAGPVRLGSDSEFYRIEERLARAGRGRRTDESVGDWLRRVGLGEPLRTTAALHLAYRFDPRGITTEQRRELRCSVELWLATTDEIKAGSAPSRTFPSL